MVNINLSKADRERSAGMKFKEWLQMTANEKRRLARFCFWAFVIWLIVMAGMILWIGVP